MGLNKTDDLREVLDCVAVKKKKKEEEFSTF
jgi:hypothetical protein